MYRILKLLPQMLGYDTKVYTWQQGDIILLCCLTLLQWTCCCQHSLLRLWLLARTGRLLSSCCSPNTRLLVKLLLSSCSGSELCCSKLFQVELLSLLQNIV